MKKITQYLFSMPLSVLLMAIFGAAIGYATFVESAKGTEVARSAIYNAAWFECLLVLLVVNLLGSIAKYKMVSRKKWSILLFHLAFVLILLGSAVTRYFGFEGVMHIREGETSNEISSEQTAVKVVATYNGNTAETITPIRFSAESENSFDEKITVGSKVVSIENEYFVPNATESLSADDKGVPGISLFAMGRESGGQELILMNNETSKMGDLNIALGESSDSATVVFRATENGLTLTPKIPLTKISMMTQEEIELLPGKTYPAEAKNIFRAGKAMFVLRNYVAKAKKELIQTTETVNKMGMKMPVKDVVVLKLTQGDVSKSVNLFCYQNGALQPTIVDVNGVKLALMYGKFAHTLPFSITLRDFVLDRYPGSESPSSFASEITVVDKEKNLTMPFRIYMNNILNYRGYRFFQSSYDTDEMGTILSVNHDYWGTMITYWGYFLLLVGMLFTLLNKNSRFRAVIQLSKQLQERRKQAKTALFIALMLFPASLFATDNSDLKQEHLKQLNQLLVQDVAQGRIEPLSTYASDILRKLTKKPEYKGQTPVEVIIGMCANGEQWQNEPMLKVGNDVLADELGAVNGYIAFSQLFDAKNGDAYRLKDKVDIAYQKEPSEQSKYDKEVIYLDERVNITYQLFSRTMLALFPSKESKGGKWLTQQPAETVKANGSTAKGGVCPYSGMTGKASGEMNMPEGDPHAGMEMSGNPHEGMDMSSDPHAGLDMTSNPHAGMDMSATMMPVSLFDSYLESYNEALKSGNWLNANTQLAALRTYQQANGGEHLPSKSQVEMEILYNRLDLFNKLAYVYLLLGMVLLGFHLMNIFKYRPIYDKICGYAFYPTLAIFAVYTAAMAMRWYVSGHAPWSNGYEAMLLVGWASSLAGLIFARRSTISMSVTALLSSIALIVAAMSWMNPEITPLVPVLKSYWLVVHVAVITSSYGFMAMAAILGLLNLFLMISRNDKNNLRLSDSIQEISYTIELSISVGLMMLTVGTFLGGVWANESWGRYWGWDSKETWALVSILVYSCILHLRLIPKMNSQFVLSTFALIGFSSVIMTFFGVNYYLTGMHSYGQGNPPPVPPVLYFIVAGIASLIVVAYLAERRNK